MSSHQKLHCGFVSGWDSPWRTFLVRAKYLLMWAQRIVYPDVFCIPYWLGWKCDFIRIGARFNPDNYDFILSELNAGVGHLDYLRELIKVNPGKIIILPGPQEIFESNATKVAQGLATWILRRAGHVWAYSEAAANFADECAQAPVAKVIPWPFDYAETRRRGRPRRNRRPETIRILLGVPLRFVGIAANAPPFLEQCFAEALAALPPAARNRFQFYAMVYTQEDETAWRQTGFGQRLEVVLEPRKNYVHFLRFLGNCDAVLTLPRFSVLGRITFLAAALGKPGIFTENVELSRRLYPRSLVESATDEQLRDRVRDLLFGLLDLGPLEPFLPDIPAAQEVGDFAGNAAKVRELLAAKVGGVG
jgi:hypothetical protein